MERAIRIIIANRPPQLINSAIRNATVKARNAVKNAPMNDFTFQGAYVYKLTLEDGFELMGRVTHYDETEVADKAGYYWYGSKDVQRILYIGDYLYTVSQGMVKANSLSDELGEVNSVELGGTENYGYVYPELI